MADSLKRMCGPALLNSTVSTFYTVPAATKAVVRSIHVNNTGSANYTFSLGINGTPTTVANAFFTNHSVPANGSFDWSGNLVLNAGETLQLLASTASFLTVTISGVESA